MAWAERCCPGHGLCSPRPAILAASCLYAVVRPQPLVQSSRTQFCLSTLHTLRGVLAVESGR